MEDRIVRRARLDGVAIHRGVFLLIVDVIAPIVRPIVGGVRRSGRFVIVHVGLRLRLCHGGDLVCLLEHDLVADIAAIRLLHIGEFVVLHDVIEDHVRVVLVPIQRRLVRRDKERAHRHGPGPVCVRHVSVVGGVFDADAQALRVRHVAVSIGRRKAVAAERGRALIVARPHRIAIRPGKGLKPADHVVQIGLCGLLQQRLNRAVHRRFLNDNAPSSQNAVEIRVQELARVFIAEVGKIGLHVDALVERHQAQAVRGLQIVLRGLDDDLRLPVRAGKEGGGQAGVCGADKVPVGLQLRRPAAGKHGIQDGHAGGGIRQRDVRAIGAG